MSKDNMVRFEGERLDSLLDIMGVITANRERTGYLRVYVEDGFLRIKIDEGKLSPPLGTPEPASGVNQPMAICLLPRGHSKDCPGVHHSPDCTVCRIPHMWAEGDEHHSPASVVTGPWTPCPACGVPMGEPGCNEYTHVSLMDASSSASSSGACRSESSSLPSGPTSSISPEPASHRNASSVAFGDDRGIARVPVDEAAGCTEVRKSEDREKCFDLRCPRCHAHNANSVVPHRAEACSLGPAGHRTHHPMTIECDGTCGNNDPHDSHLACEDCGGPMWKCRRPVGSPCSNVPAHNVPLNNEPGNSAIAPITGYAAWLVRGQEGDKR